VKSYDNASKQELLSRGQEWCSRLYRVYKQTRNNTDC